MSKRLINNPACQGQGGFTFIEVLIAILIFTMVVVSAIGIIRGSVRATQESRDLSRAAWLLQSKMVELETNLDTLGVDKACDKKKSGKFEIPNDQYSWLTTCEQIDIKLPEASAMIPKDKDKDSSDEQDTQENQILKMIMQTASDYMSKSIRELHAEIIWNQGKTKRVVTATTEWAAYDQPLNIPGMGAPTTPGSTPGVKPLRRRDRDATPPAHRSPAGIHSNRSHAGARNLHHHWNFYREANSAHHEYKGYGVPRDRHV